MQKNFLSALLLYLEPVSIEKNQKITRWNPPQLLELQIHALNIVSHLVGLVPQHFHEIEGHKILARFVQMYTDIPRRKSALMAILNCTFFEFFKIDLEQSNLIKTMIELIKEQTQPGTLYIRELSFNILSYVTKGCREN